MQINRLSLYSVLALQSYTPRATFLLVRLFFCQQFLCIYSQFSAKSESAVHAAEYEESRLYRSVSWPTQNTEKTPMPAQPSSLPNGDQQKCKSPTNTHSTAADVSDLFGHS